MPELTVNHSPEPWSLHSGGTPETLFEVRAGAIILALIVCEEDQPILALDLANSALILAAPRMLRVIRELVMHAAPHSEAIELLTDLKKAGVF